MNWERRSLDCGQEEGPEASLIRRVLKDTSAQETK